MPMTERIQQLFDLTGEVAVAIGAAGVLGGAIAKGFAEAGAKVAILDLNEEKGQARVEEIQKVGGTAIFCKTDATDRESLQAAREKVEAELGPVTILLNAAGGNSPKVTVTPELKFEDLKLEDWNANFNLNLVGGALLPCQVFGPGMVQRRKGSIINIASVSAHVPLSRVPAYSAAKAAVLNLTRVLAREWGPYGVRVNTITPGFFPAEQNRRLLFNEDGTPTPRAQQILNHTPMGRMGEPEELVAAAIFLASPKASSFVNGADLRVDGGFLAQTI